MKNNEEIRATKSIVTMKIFKLQYLIAFLMLQTKSNANSEAEECRSVTIELSGAGSSFPSAMYQEIGAMYSANRSLDRKISFTFDRVNSVYGKERIMMKNPTLPPIVFAASEARLSHAEKNADPKLLTFPTVAGALAIVFKLPRINQINLTVQSVAEIFSGKIQYWNDPSIQLANPGLELPAKQILVVARSDAGAGDTLIFTSALSSISQQWNQSYGTFADPEFSSGDECCNSTKWPRGVVQFYGNRVTGVVGIVASVPYTIGYAAWANTIGMGVTHATIVNTYGTLVDVSTTTVQAAINYYLNMQVINDEDNGLEYDINNALSINAYPFASFSYMIINRTGHPNITCCQIQELTGFVDWLFRDDAINVIIKYGLVPLSTNATNFIKERVLPAILCQGISAYQQYRQSLTVDKPFLAKNKTTIVITCSILVMCLLIISILFAVYYRRHKMINENQWLIRDVRILIKNNESLVENDSLRFTKNFFTSSVSSSANLNLTSEKTDSGSPLFDAFGVHINRLFVGCWDRIETDVLMSKFQPKSGTLNFDRKTKMLLTKYQKEIQHSNLLQFFGLTAINNEFYSINQYSNFKGTLHHVLNTCPYNIDRNIKYSLAVDILEGLRYLHQRHIGHGRMSSLECYIDVVWRVKIVRWELSHVTLTTSVPPPWSTPLETEEDLIRLLYLDPYMWTPSLTYSLYLSDVYSYGILLIEIFTRKLPYFNEVELELTTYSKVIEDKFQNRIFTPDVSITDAPSSVQALIQKLMSPLESRPTDIAQVYRQAKAVVSSEKSVVDTLMQSMETYMSELEDKILERTAELSQMTNRMKDLLNNVLPPQIALKLFRGENVEPEFYECCTIFFSDIVGFTMISARSTPIQVMTFLNTVYTLFDKTIEQFDVYKVDTIGDAYMVASGLPVRNGISHCRNIGLMALALMKRINDFEIVHFPGEKLKVRMGINSGPVTAGIIGEKMPQYCVFGDAVNTASRMESTSLPGKIQISEMSHNFFQKYYPKFNFDARGEVEVKGKGKMKCYWLISCEE